MEHELIPRPQPRAAAAERLQMVEHFRRSGLTRAAYSRQYQIPLATLNWWIAKARRTSALAAPMPLLFSEVRLPPPATPANSWAMELVNPAGLTIRCRETIPMRELVRLLRGPRC